MSSCSLWQINVHWLISIQYTDRAKVCRNLKVSFNDCDHFLQRLNCSFGGSSKVLAFLTDQFSNRFLLLCTIKTPLKVFFLRIRARLKQRLIKLGVRGSEVRVRANSFIGRGFESWSGISSNLAAAQYAAR